MVSGDRLTVTLLGGAPWGFRLQGGGTYPLEVAKIRKKSRANEADLREGDRVLSINGIELSGKSHQSAMDLVEMASDSITMDVVRSSSGPPAVREIDPQRQPRIIPMVGEAGSSGPGVMSTATAKYSTVEGNTRRDVHTEEVQVQSAGGKKITKTVTEERVTRYNGAPDTWQAPSQGPTVQGTSSSQPARSPVMWQPQGPPPAPTKVQVQVPQPPQPSMTSRSPLMWQPQNQQSQTPAPVPQATQQSMAGSRSPLMWQPPTQAAVTQPTQQQQPMGSRSPLMWQPQNMSSAPNKENIQPPKVPPKPRLSPSPQRHAEVARAQVQQSSATKENLDPEGFAEHTRNMNKLGPPSVPKFSLKQFGGTTPASKYGGPSGYSNKGPSEPIQRVDDPRYPMFEAFTPTWQPSKEATRGSEPMSIMSAPQPYGTSQPFEVSQPPMAPPQLPPQAPPAPPSPQKPSYYIPPPPPMPPPEPRMPSTGHKTKKFRPGHTSTPVAKSHHDIYDDMDTHEHRPDHLPVFAPKVTISLDEDSGYPTSPVRENAPDLMEEESDISSLGNTKKKLFSDSAFYDDPSAKFPTIKEQMNMCKLIAKSLTSAANRRAKGARMFAKRKRKSTRWVHEGRSGFSSEYSSSADGDVADLTDLESELFQEEGGTRPLFSFRIPSIAAQSHEPSQKMSLTKDEFERLRLGGSRCEHQNVSPNMCFSIAADLHSSKNRGAKLFQKRQQKSEKWVIDETNAKKPLPPMTKLERIVQSPLDKKSPWEAAAEGNMEGAFHKMNMLRNVQNTLLVKGPAPKLQPQCQIKKLEGEDFNRKARGWSSVAMEQQYRDPSSPIPGSGLRSPGSPVEEPQSYMSPEQYGNYNRRVKAWPGRQRPLSGNFDSPRKENFSSVLPPQPCQRYDMQFDLSSADL